MRRRREQAGEVEDVADLGRPEGVDRLGIVTDDGHPATIRLHSRQNQRLEAVGILILIHQHMLEALADCVRDRWLAHHLGPVEQQVIVIEDVLALLCLNVALEQGLELALPILAPGKLAREHHLDWELCIHRERIDCKACRLQREASLLRG